MNYSITYRTKDGTLTISNSLTKSALSISVVSHEDATLVTEITAGITRGEQPEAIKKKLDSLLQSEHAPTFITFLFCWVHEYLTHIEADYDKSKRNTKDRRQHPEAWNEYAKSYFKQKQNLMQIIKLCF